MVCSVTVIRKQRKMGHLFVVSVYTIQEQIEHKYPDLEFTKFAFLCFVDYEYQRIFSRPITLCDIDYV
jgi:hypothetical protein